MSAIPPWSTIPARMMRNSKNQYEHFLVVGHPDIPGTDNVPKSFAIPVSSLQASYLTLDGARKPYFMRGDEPIELEPMTAQEEQPQKTSRHPFSEFTIAQALNLKA